MLRPGCCEEPEEVCLSHLHGAEGPPRRPGRCNRQDKAHQVSQLHRRSMSLRHSWALRKSP